MSYQHDPGQYGQGQYGQHHPQGQPAPGPYAPAQVGRPGGWTAASPPRTRSAEVNPGWTARILFWCALVLGHLPALVAFPIAIASGDNDNFEIYAILSNVVGVLEMLLGVLALLLVKGTSWARRLIAGGVFVFVGLYSMLVPRLISALMFRISMDFDMAIGFQSVIYAFHSIVILAGILIAWNLVRNRSWWTHLVAIGIAVVAAGMVALLQWLVNLAGASAAVSAVIAQLLRIGVEFAGLGLLHLLGGMGKGGRSTKRGHPTPTAGPNQWTGPHPGDRSHQNQPYAPGQVAPHDHWRRPGH